MIEEVHEKFDIKTQKTQALPYSRPEAMNNSLSPLSGRIINLSMLAVQLLIMAAVINIFAAFFFIQIGGADVDTLGADDVMGRTGTQYEEQIVGEHRQGFEDAAKDHGFDKKEQLAHRLATSALKDELDSYFVPMVLFILLAFATIRYHLIDSNKAIKPNLDKQKQDTEVLESIRQSLAGIFYAERRRLAG